MLPVTRQLRHHVTRWAPICRANFHSLPLTHFAGSSISRGAEVQRPLLTVCRWQRACSSSSSSNDEFVSVLGIKLPTVEAKPDVGPTGLGEAREPEPATWFTSRSSSTDISTSDGDGADLESAQVVVEKKKKELDYHALPIVLLKLTKNNTRVLMTKADYSHIASWTAGCCGFKNSKRGTNVAGQACAEVLAKRAREKGFSFVRVVIRGVGAARVDAVRGLEVGGLRIVSITDDTMHSPGRTRARKRRRM